MDMAVPMHTDSSVLTLAQWLSPAFPIGAFAYSHGLEGAAEAGWITDATSVEVWLRDILSSGAGRTDSLIIAASYNAKTPKVITEIDKIVRAFAVSAERRTEIIMQGKAFCNAIDGWNIKSKPFTYPVAIGYAAARKKLPLMTTQELYLLSFLSNLVAASQRLLPVGQKAGVDILRRLTPLCQEIATKTNHGDITKLKSETFLSDISSMRHEHQITRVFRT